MPDAPPIRMPVAVTSSTRSESVAQLSAMGLPPSCPHNTRGAAAPALGPAVEQSGHQNGFGTNAIAAEAESRVKSALLQRSHVSWADTNKHHPQPVQHAPRQHVSDITLQRDGSDPASRSANCEAYSMDEEELVDLPLVELEVSSQERDMIIERRAGAQVLRRERAEPSRRTTDEQREESLQPLSRLESEMADAVVELRMARMQARRKAVEPGQASKIPRKRLLQQ